MKNEQKSKVLEEFTQVWWRSVVEHREEITPTDWLIVLGTMTGMLVDSVTENEEEAGDALIQFTNAVSGVAARFVNSNIQVPPLQ